MMEKRDVVRVRALAEEVRAFAESPEMQRRRRLWTDHNSLLFTRPLIYIRSVPFEEFPESRELQCEDPALRSLERNLLKSKYYTRVPCDTIIEPYITVRAAVDVSEKGVYGLPSELGEKAAGIRCAAFAPSIMEEEDVEKLHVAPYQVDEEETARRVSFMKDVLGDTLDVAVDREAPLCEMWSNDISTQLARLRGLNQIMWDVYDRPEWLKKFCAWMRDRILEQIDQTEAAEGFRLNNHQNQAMPYCRELEAPSASDKPVSVKQLWGYCAAQEFTAFGPEMFDEFCFQYQKPILERYGLAAYACCEDVTHKIGIIRTLKNLRRIGVSPFSDPVKCAEQIGGDYVLSYRPNPSSACSRGVNEAFVRGELQRVMDAFDQNNCKWDITLKDLETTTGDPTAIIRWTSIVRDEIDKRYGR